MPYFPTRYSAGKFLCRNHRGITLVEVIATLVSNSILLLGLTSCILLSKQSLDIVSTNQQEVYQQRQVLDQFRSDLREAVNINTPSPKTLEIVVPDRNGDSTPDKITYVFPEPKSQALLRDSLDLNTAYSIGTTTLSIREPFFIPTSSRHTAPTVLEVVKHSVTLTSKLSNTVSVAMPGNTTAGDMLIAIIGTRNTAGNISVGPGTWTPLLNTESDNLKAQIWWRLASANETADIIFTSANTERFSSSIIRVHGHNGTIISTQKPVIGAAIYPNSNSCTTTANNMLAFQVLVATQASYYRDLTGLFAHTNLVMEAGSQNSQAVTLGIGYRKFATPTPSSAYTFLLKDSQPYITCSFAIGALEN